MIWFYFDVPLYPPSNRYFEIKFIERTYPYLKDYYFCETCRSNMCLTHHNQLLIDSKFIVPNKPYFEEK